MFPSDIELVQTSPEAGFRLLQESSDFYNFTNRSTTDDFPLANLDLSNCRESRFERARTVIAIGKNSSLTWNVA